MYKWTCFATTLLVATVALILLHDLKTEVTTALRSAQTAMEQANQAVTTVNARLPEIISEVKRGTETLSELAEDLELIKSVAGIESQKEDRWIRGLATYANEIQQVLQVHAAGKNAVILVEEILSSDLKEAETVEEFLVGLNKEMVAIILPLAKSPQEILFRATHSAPPRRKPFYIRFPASEPVRLDRFIKNHHDAGTQLPDYPDQAGGRLNFSIDEKAGEVEEPSNSIWEIAQGMTKRGREKVEETKAASRKKIEQLKDDAREAAGEAARNVGDRAGVGEELRKAVTLEKDDVVAMGRQLITHLDSKNSPAPEASPYAIRLQRLIANHTEENGEILNFKVYLSDTVNAFACPDGSIRVYSGLMDLLDDDELRGVLGHEIGHLKGNHSMEKLRMAYLARAGKKVAGRSLVKTLGDSTPVILSAFVITELTERYLNAQYSQHEELEADDYALDFMQRYGYEARALSTAFQKLARLGKSRIAAFSSHPDPLERAQRIREKL